MHSISVFNRSWPSVQLPEEIGDASRVGMNAYQRVTALTDNFEDSELDLPILGLFGEVGGLLSALKKKQRDQSYEQSYDEAIAEELGDVLWYFTRIASRAKLDLSVIAQRAFRDMSDWDEVMADEAGIFGDIHHVRREPITSEEFSGRVVQLAGRVGDLMNDLHAGAFSSNRDKLAGHLVEIFRAIIEAADAAEVELEDAARQNLYKIFSRWPHQKKYPALFDENDDPAERLPRQLEVEIFERERGGNVLVFQRCNGLNIGDPLTDNKEDPDDYRFHDVFHYAYAAILGWSPVMRALFKLKRKSDPVKDENQDGARANLVEEGISTWIFNRAQKQDFFAGVEPGKLSYDMLKTVHQFASGYEAERCPLWLWEEAILEGFRCFRYLKEHRQGRLILDLEKRSIDIEAL
ncbi:pyrophosphatase [Sinisalibacter aestuarii]|uniref:Pyrophosphatase n=2 Tax=Sinisalibacter aestuarii TaxID=2949426 RepID=A0ABQ5LT08_9RHOB|nr:pyrophosphatase [Sinisalibacter aestuarii]